jgi:hypothetical protein
VIDLLNVAVLGQAKTFIEAASAPSRRLVGGDVPQPLTDRAELGQASGDGRLRVAERERPEADRGIAPPGRRPARGGAEAEAAPVRGRRRVTAVVGKTAMGRWRLPPEQEASDHDEGNDAGASEREHLVRDLSRHGATIGNFDREVE